MVFDPVVNQDALEYVFTGAGAYLKGIGKAHEGHTKVADAHMTLSQGAVLQENVYHIAVFMEDGDHKLKVPGFPLVDIKACGLNSL